MQQRRSPAPGDERQHEHQADREPDVPGVDDPAERAVIAARHRPRDLEAGPRLRDLAGVVVDIDLHELALGRARLGRREPAHLPLRGALRVLVGNERGVLAQLGLHDRAAASDREHLERRVVIPDRRSRLVGDEHGGTRRGRDRLGLGHRRDRGARCRAACGGCARRGQGSRNEREREQQAEEQRPRGSRPGPPGDPHDYFLKLQSFWPRKLTGITMMLARALMTTLCCENRCTQWTPATTKP